MGAIFVGWRDQHYNWYHLYQNYEMPGHDLDLFAEWMYLTRSVYYDDNGGQGGPGIEGYNFGHEVYISLIEPTKDGFSFAGWLLEGSIYNPGDYYGPISQDLSLVAQWEQTYTVHYDANGGSGAPLNRVNCLPGDIIIVSSIVPMNIGFLFAGWLYEGGIFFGGNAITMPVNDITLLAKWDEIFTVTYDGNGGTGAPFDDNDYVNGDLVSVSSLIPLNPGYLFSGWSYGGSTYYGGNSFSIAGSDVTLVAQWDKIYNVFYDANGGSGAPSNANDYISGDSVTVSAVIPTNPGYLFKGWSYGGSTYYGGNSFSIASSDVTLVAQWDKIYNVFYDANGGSGAPSDTTDYVSGDSVSVSSVVPLKAGFIFAGWLYDANTYFDGDSFLISDSDVTLVAQWTPEAASEYTVTINGSYAATAGSGNYAAGAVVTINAGTRPGYQFAGWNVDTLNVILTRDDTAVTTFIMPDAAVILTANWQVLENPATGDRSLLGYLLTLSISLTSILLTKNNKRKED